jgi:lipoprotein Spr
VKIRVLDTDENNFETGTPKEKMLMEIINYLNVPYQYGGNSKSGIDCSAFTQNVYKSTLSVNLFRSAREQYKQGEVISDVDDLQFGDLVFFDTRSGVSPGHVGIYIGDDLFAHASSKKGVTISSLNHTYYKDRFMGSRRIEPEGTF